MEVSVFEYISAIVFPLLMSVVLIVMTRRKLYLELPCFFAYVAYHICQSAAELALLWLHVSTAVYFYGYYLMQAVSFALSFAVIYEIFASVFRPYQALRVLASRTFLIATATLVIVGLVLLSFGPGDQSYKLVRSIDIVQRSLRVVQLGLLLLLFFLSRSLALNWKSYSFGIALGYGLFASVELVILALKIEYPVAPLRLLSFVNSISYGTAQVIWAWYILQPKRVAQPVRVIPHNDLEKWNEKLEELLKPKAPKKSDVEEEENDDQPVSK